MQLTLKWWEEDTPCLLVLPYVCVVYTDGNHCLDLASFPLQLHGSVRAH